MEKFWSSIRFKTVGVQIAGALAITICLAIASFIIIRSYILKTSLSHSHMIARSAANEISEFLEDRQKLMERITASREFEDYLKTYRELPLLKHLSKFDLQFSSIAFLNKEGGEEVKIIGTKNAPPELNFRSSTFFQGSLEHPNTVITSHAENSLTTGEPVITMFLTKTGYFGDEFIGTLRAEVPLIDIRNKIDKLSEGQRGFLTIISKGGEVLQCTAGNNTHLNRIMNQEVLGMAGSPDHDSRYVRNSVFGTDSIVVASPVENTQWTLLRIVPYTNITGPLISLMRIVVITLAIIMVLTIIASIILSGQITKRIIELSEATTHIARGHFSLNVPVNSSDEIGDLAASFNSMVNALQTTTVSRAELEEKNTFLYHVVDSISYPFFVVSLNDLAVTLTNDIIRQQGDFKRASCYRMAEAIGTPCLWCDGHCSLLSIKETKQPVVMEVLNHEISGPRYYQIHAFPLIDRSGSVTEIIEYCVDITEKRMAARKLEQSARKLKTANEDLQNFLHIASHDLNEPLRKVIAFGDRLKVKYHEVLGEKGRDYLDRMQGAAGRMQVLLNDLLAYSRVTTKARPFEPTDLSLIIHEVLDVLEIKLEQSGARVEIGELTTLQADPLQLRQVMQNLIGNALKFVRKDTIPLIRVHGSFITDRIKNGGPAPNKLYELKIEDNGIGFQEDHAERIFGVFEKLHAQSEYEGSGVGLSICRKIIERHGGTIKAKGIPGEGAQFVITLPVTY